MSGLSFTKLREDLSEILNKVSYKGERIVITRHRKQVAAVISMDDLKKLEALEERLDLEKAQALKERVDNGEEEVLDWDEVKKEL